MRIWLALALMLDLSTGAVAQNSPEPPTRDAGFSKVLSGDGGTSLNAGLNTINKAQLPCVTGTLSCKFAISAMVIIDNSGSPNPWSICAAVDGVPAEPSCANQPDVQDHPVTGTSIQILKVKPGTHEVSLQVYVSGLTTLGGWSVIYQAYPN